MTCLIVVHLSVLWAYDIYFDTNLIVQKYGHLDSVHNFCTLIIISCYYWIFTEYILCIIHMISSS
jgi:hypothetical protein